MPNVIDDLQLRVSAEVKRASDIDRLSTSLLGLAKSTHRVGNSAAEVNKLRNALSGIDKVIRADKILDLADALHHLAHVKLDNLRLLSEFKGAPGVEKLASQLKDVEKHANIDLKVNAEDINKTISNAIRMRGSSLDGGQLAKKLAKSFQLAPDDAKQLRTQIEDAIGKAASGADVSNQVSGIVDTLTSGGTFKGRDLGLGDELVREYEEAWKVINSPGFRGWTSNSVDAGDWKGFIQSRGFQKYFNNKTGTPIDTDDFFNSYPEIASKIEADWKSGLLLDIDGLSHGSDELQNFLNLLEEIKYATKGAPLSFWNDTSTYLGRYDDVAKEFSQNALYQSIVNSGAKEKMESAVSDSLGTQETNINLKVNLNEDYIIETIKKAIRTAENYKYPDINLKLGVNVDDLKASIRKTLRDIDTTSIGNISSDMGKLAGEMQKFNGADVKSSGITEFVNSLNKMGNIEPDKLKTLSGTLQEITQSLSALNGVNTKESGLNALIDSIAKLSKLDDSKMQTLRDNLQGIIDAMANAPAVADSTVRYAEALAQLAQSGAQAGKAVGAVNKAMNQAAAGSSQRGVEELSRMMLNGFGNFSSRALSSIGRTAQSAGSGIKSLMQNIVGLGRTTSSVNTLTGNIKLLLGTVLGFRGISGVFNWMKEAFTAGADITEIDHIIESTFGEMQGAVNGWARNAIEKFGIAESSAKRYAGTLSAMFQASNIGYHDAARMSTDLVELAGDLSAFYNIDTETAFRKIQSGMAGQTRPLMQLGIDMRVAALNEFAMAQGLSQTYSQMNTAEKEMLRYQYLMAVTSTQQGDFARTAYSSANALRTLRAYASAVTASIGTGLSAAIRPVIVALNGFMKVALKAAQAFAVFMQTLFGKYKGGASGVALEITDMDNDLSDAAGSAGDVGKGASDAGKGLGKAADSASDLKKTLTVLPFDELNQLAKDMSSAGSGGPGGSGGSGGGGGGGGGSTTVGVPDGLLDVDELMANSDIEEAISEWAQRIKAAFDLQDWELLGQEIAWGFNRGFDSLYDAFDTEKFKAKVTPFLEAATTTFNSFVDALHMDRLGAAVGEAVNDITYVFEYTLSHIDWKNIGSKFSEGVVGFVDEVDAEQIGKVLGEKFMLVPDIVYGFVSDFTDEGGWQKVGKKISDGVMGAVKKIDLSEIAETLAVGLNGAFTTLDAFNSGMDWEVVANNIATGISTFVATFDWKGNGDKLERFIKNLVEAILDAVDGADWEGLGKGIGDMLTRVHWVEHLAKVGAAIASAIGQSVFGLMHTPAGIIVTELVLSLVGISTAAKMLPFANALCQAITGQTFMQAMFSGFGTTARAQMTTSLNTAMANASGQLATGTGASALSGTLSNILVGGTVGATLGALVVGSAEVQKKLELLSGKNGILTNIGTAVDEYAGALLRANQITKDQYDSVIQLKEGMEHQGKATSEVASAVVQSLIDMGVPAGELKNVVQALGGSGQFAEEAINALGEAVERHNPKAVASTFTYTDLSKIIRRFANTTDDAMVATGNLESVMDASQSSGLSAQAAYEGVRKEAQELGYDVTVLDEIIGKQFPDALKRSSKNAADSGAALDAVGYKAGALATNAKSSSEGIKKSNKAVKNSYRGMSNSVKAEIQKALDADTKYDKNNKTVSDNTNQRIKTMSMDHTSLGKTIAQTFSTSSTNTRSWGDTLQKTFLGSQSIASGVISTITEKLDGLPKSTNLDVNLRKGSWDSTAWSVFDSNGKTGYNTVNQILAKGAFDGTAKLVFDNRGGSASHTVKENLYNGSYSSDAKAIFNARGGSASHTVKENLREGSWDSDAWRVFKAGAGTVYRYLSQAVKKGSWTSEAWTAAKMTGGTVYKTISVSIKALLSGLSAKVRKLLNLHTGGIFKGGHWQPIQSFASGGYPFGGQIFRARENGNPELVGTLRGSTAVMNNNQIVASVSAGVAKAIAGIHFQLRGMTPQYHLPSLQDLGFERTVVNGVREGIISTMSEGQRFTLDELKEAMTDAFAEVMVAFAGSGTNGAETNGGDFIVYLGDEEVYRSAMRGKANINKRQNPMRFALG